jgi:hypothetical protein
MKAMWSTAYSASRPIAPSRGSHRPQSALGPPVSKSAGVTTSISITVRGLKNGRLLDQGRWTPAAAKLPVLPSIRSGGRDHAPGSPGFHVPADGLSANTRGLLDARERPPETAQCENRLSCRIAQDVAHAGDRTCVLRLRQRAGRAQLIAGFEVPINCRRWVSTECALTWQRRFASSDRMAATALRA